MDEGGNSDQVNPAAGPISPVVAVRASSPLEWPLGLDSGAKRSELKLPSRPMRGLPAMGHEPPARSSGVTSALACGADAYERRP